MSEIPRPCAKHCLHQKGRFLVTFRPEEHAHLNSDLKGSHMDDTALWKLHLSETKNQPKEQVFGRTSLRTSGQKTSVRPSKSWKNKHLGTDMLCGRP